MAKVKAAGENRFGVDIVKEEHLFIADARKSWDNHYGNQCGDSYKLLEIDLPCDLGIYFSSIFTKNSLFSHRDTCSFIFIAVLFTLAGNGSSLVVHQPINRW